MIYEEIKNWLAEQKPKITLLVCFVLVFLIGFGTGKYYQNGNPTREKPVQADYTTKKPVVEEQAENSPAAQVQGAAVGGTSDAAKDCVIKGNISSKGAKIYHVPGGAFYDKTNPEQCFNTEAEAKAAGFKKSSR